jgi:hypothetical protein
LISNLSIGTSSAVRRHPRDGQRADASSHPEYTRFDEQQSKQPVGRCAQRKPHRDLGGAVRNSCEQKVRDVGAGNREHEPGDREHQHEEDPCLAAVGIASPRPLLQGDLSLQELLTFTFVHLTLQDWKLHVANQRREGDFDQHGGLFA